MAERRERRNRKSPDSPKLSALGFKAADVEAVKRLYSLDDPQAIKLILTPGLGFDGKRIPRFSRLQHAMHHFAKPSHREIIGLYADDIRRGSQKLS